MAQSSSSILAGGEPALSKAGVWAFIIGMILAVLASFVSIIPWLPLASAGVTVALVMLGLIVGLINVRAKETRDFLLVATALVVVAYAGGSANLVVVPVAGNIIAAFFNNMMNFAIPAAIVAGLKEIYKLSKG